MNVFFLFLEMIICVALLMEESHCGIILSL